ncbi:MAG: RNA helicase, partial [Aliarcobacter sp.]|nr:RNA helicase [Aliarcobacter sp.]
YNLKFEDKYLLAQAPITKKSTIIIQAYDAYIASVIKKKVCHYKPSITLPKKAITQKDLLLVEDEVKKISLYLWLSYKLPELFPDHAKAYILRNSFNAFIEKSLRGNLIQEEMPRRTFDRRRETEKKDDKTEKNVKKSYKPRRRKTI